MGSPLQYAVHAPPSSLHPPRVAHVLVDVPALLHGLVRTAAHHAFLVHALLDALDALVERYQPSVSLLIALDGVAALAKLLVQRRRRFSSSAGMRYKALSPMEVTPGTELMRTVNEALRYYAVHRLINRGAQQPQRIVVSGADVRGEAEHKIAAYLRTRVEDGESALIVGTDSDLLLIALASPARELYVHQETTLWDVAALRGNLLASVVQPQLRLRQSAYLRDFVLCCCFSGNDYLPEMQAAGTWRALWPEYSRIVGTCERSIVSADFCIHRPTLLCLLERVHEHETGETATRRTYTDAESVLVESYLLGCEWALATMLTGVCRSYTYFYPYPSAPTLMQTIAVLRGTRKVQLKSSSDLAVHSTPVAQTGEWDVLRALLALTPPTESALLPTAMQGAFLELFPDDFYEFDASWQQRSPAELVAEVVDLADTLLRSISRDELDEDERARVAAGVEHEFALRGSSDAVGDVWPVVTTPLGCENVVDDDAKAKLVYRIWTEVKAETAMHQETRVSGRPSKRQRTHM